jgi:predicted transcriptional regulator
MTPRNYPSHQQKLRSKIMDGNELNLTSLTAEIVSAYVSHNAISGEQLPAFIGSVHAALNQAATSGVEPPKVELTPAVPVKKSVTPEYINCLEDGKKFKSLKRHLRTHYDLSPEQYREKWGLSHDYPMVAPAYAAARSQLAKTMGLGRRSGETAAPPQTSGGKKARPAAKGARK